MNHLASAFPANHPIPTADQRMQAFIEDYRSVPLRTFSRALFLSKSCRNALKIITHLDGRHIRFVVDELACITANLTRLSHGFARPTELDRLSVSLLFIKSCQQVSGGSVGEGLCDWNNDQRQNLRALHKSAPELESPLRKILGLGNEDDELDIGIERFRLHCDSELDRLYRKYPFLASRIRSTFSGHQAVAE